MKHFLFFFCFLTVISCTNTSENELNFFTLSHSVSPVDGGSILLSESPPFYKDSQISITAVPASNYKFSHWTGDLNGTEESQSLLINSDKGEVMVGESTSVNLYKIIHALLESNEFNKALISDSLNFPSDLYVLDGLKNLTTKNKIKIIEYKNDIKCDLNLLKKNIKSDPGIYCLSLVSYKSSYLYPLNELNKVAEENGSVIVWDCSHISINS